MQSFETSPSRLADPGELDKQVALVRKDDPKLVEDLQMWHRFALMETVIVEVEKVVLGKNLLSGKRCESQPDMRQRDLIGHLLHDCEYPGELSTRQEDLIIDGVSRYVFERSGVRDYRAWLTGSNQGRNRKGKIGRRGKRRHRPKPFPFLLQKAGLGNCGFSEMDLHLNHPLATGISVPDEMFELHYVGSELMQDPKSAEAIKKHEQAKTTGGLVWSEKDYDYPAFDGKIFLMRRSLARDVASVTADHEGVHVMHHRLYLPNVLNKSLDDLETWLTVILENEILDNSDALHRAFLLETAGIVRFGDFTDYTHKVNCIYDFEKMLFFLKSLQGELIAYCWTGEYRFDESSLLPETFAEVEFKTVEVRQSTENFFYKIIVEMERLKEAGYKAQELYPTLLTSRSVEEATNRLKMIGRDASVLLAA
jgi:hypothetical protein